MADLHHEIRVKLYDNYLTDNPGDFVAKVFSSKTVDIPKICHSAVNRAKAPTSIEAMEHNVQMFLKEMAFLLMDGYSVNTGYFVAIPTVRGVFDNRTETFNPQKHSVLFRFNQGETLRKEIPNIKVQVLGVGETGIIISHVVDMKTGSVNDQLTPGGTLKIKGGKLKLVGDNPQVGVSFTDEAGNEYRVELADVLINNPSELLVHIPAMSPGKYQLAVANQYSVGAILKEPRTAVFEKTLTVSA